MTAGYATSPRPSRPLAESRKPDAWTVLLLCPPPELPPWYHYESSTLGDDLSILGRIVGARAEVIPPVVTNQEKRSAPAVRLPNLIFVLERVVVPDFTFIERKPKTPVTRSSAG